MTRAKKRVIIIGESWKQLEQTIKRPKQDRQTSLSQKVEEAIDASTSDQDEVFAFSDNEEFDELVNSQEFQDLADRLQNLDRTAAEKIEVIDRLWNEYFDTFYSF